MKFAHFADIHIGSWRDPKLRDLSTRAFAKAVDICIEEQADFILIAGDFFNTALPSIDLLKQAVTKLKDLRDHHIPVYVIPGSHDFAASGKTMLDVLENAALLRNVVRGETVDGKLKLRFTVDAKTGAKITGVLGKKGQLDRSYYESLMRENLEQESGYKIFMFHTGIEELKPSELAEMNCHPLSLLPKNFHYYAGGHIHYIFQKNEEGYGTIAYPGALFPCNFAELEKYGRGGFYMVENGKAEWRPIQIYNSHHIKINAEHKTPQQVEEEIRSQIEGNEFVNTIITLRVEGKLASGKPSDIPFRDIFNLLYDKGAYFVMKKTTKLTSEEFEEIQVAHSSVEELERNLIQEHLGQMKLEHHVGSEQKLIQQLMDALAIEKAEGETNTIFEERVQEKAKQLFGL